MLKQVYLLLFSCYCSVIFCQSRTLDYFLDQGVQNSPLLKDYQNQISSASLDSLMIKASKMPLVEAKSQLLYSPAYKNFGYDEVITDGGNYQAVVGVSQSIFNSRALNNKYQAIGIQKQSVNNSSRISIKELKKLITDQYLIAFADFSDLAFNKSFLDLLNNENEIVRQFTRNGIYKQTDYFSLLVEMQGQEILVSQIKNLFRRDLNLLYQICGISDTALYELSVPALTKGGIPDISRSPHFIQYQIDSLKILNEKNAIDVKYQPKLNWFADAGILTSNPWNFYRHFGYSAGLSFSLPIYDGQQKNHEKQKLVLSENTRSSYKNNYILKYGQQVQQLNRELMALQETSIQIEKQLSTSNQLITASKALLNSGNISMIEYINTIKNFRSINRNLNQIRIQILQVINEQNYLMVQ
jgi:outer membrane protein TolC